MINEIASAIRLYMGKTVKTADLLPAKGYGGGKPLGCFPAV